MVLHRIHTSSLIVALVGVVLGACGGDSSGPPRNAVASVTVSPQDPAILVGQDVQLQATALNASGGTISGKTVTWSSNAQGVATVSSSGLATGAGAGTAQITATIDGKTGSTTVSVAAAGQAPTVTGVAPSPLQVGTTATLSGTGFTTSSRVLVNGVPGAVSSATATSLQFTVPCLTPGDGSVVVANGNLTSAPLAATVTAASASTLPLGELVLLSSPMCVQLSAAGAESYLVGVQSVNESVSVLTGVTFGLDASGSTTTTSFSAGLQRAPSISGAVPPIVPHDEAAARWRSHRSAELNLRARDRAIMAPRFAATQRNLQQQHVAALSTTAAAVMMAEVGDTLDLRYPDPEGNLCEDFAPVEGVVRHISDQAIFVADVNNPANGYDLADYQNFGGLLDDRILATEIAYFGAPTDLDQNGHIIVLFTKEVNERENILGMVSSTDFTPRTGTGSCPSSNEGEIYYGRAPDPDGTVGVAYPVEDARFDAPALIAHEVTHIIQFGRRLEFPGATSFPRLWELESQATFAEEVVGHDLTGRTIGQNYGFEVAWDNCEENAVDIAWYCDQFSDLALYYGFESQTTRIEGAPEQCSWLGREDNGPCISQRLVYTGWSFLRWLSDHYGPALGGEQVLHQRLIENAHTGFATIEDVIGEPIDELLAHWAAMLYTDDRYVGMDARLTLPSWNLFDIEGGLRETAHLQPYQLSFADVTRNVSIRAGSSAYFLVSGGRNATALRATTQTGATLPSHMRMWIVRVQ